MPVVPRNRTGKKLELPAKKILLGAALDDVASRDVLADPTSLDPFVALAAATEPGIAPQAIARSRSSAPG